jgi:hypothetical protein
VRPSPSIRTAPPMTVRVASTSPARGITDITAPQFPESSLAADVMGVPAWKSHPSWYLVAADDRAIPPDAS